MSDFPPPPIWAQPQLPPAWLDWFTRLAYIVTQNGGVLDGNGQDAVLTLTNFTATKNGPTIQLAFTNSNPDNTAFVQIFRNTTSDPNTATLQTTIAGGVNAFVDSVGAGVGYYYWVRPITKGGTSGTVTGPVTATTDSWSAIVGGSVIAKVTSLPGTGTEGEVVYLTTDDKLYRHTGTAWVTWTDGSDLLASSVTAGKISTASLSAISTTTGTLTVDSSGYIRGGQTAYNTGTGFFLGYESAAYKFSVGNPSGRRMTWDGTNFYVSGAIIPLFAFATGGATATTSSYTFLGTEKVYIIIWSNGASASDNVEIFFDTTSIHSFAVPSAPADKESAFLMTIYEHSPSSGSHYYKGTGDNTSVAIMCFIVQP